MQWVLWGATAVKLPTPRAPGGRSGAEPRWGAGRSLAMKILPFHVHNRSFLPLLIYHFYPAATCQKV
eukprot:2123094-Prymnesium_polylepis.1